MTIYAHRVAERGVVRVVEEEEDVVEADAKVVPGTNRICYALASACHSDLGLCAILASGARARLQQNVPATVGAVGCGRHNVPQERLQRRASEGRQAQRADDPYADVTSIPITPRRPISRRRHRWFDGRLHCGLPGWGDGGKERVWGVRPHALFFFFFFPPSITVKDTPSSQNAPPCR